MVAQDDTDELDRRGKIRTTKKLRLTGNDEATLRDAVAAEMLVPAGAQTGWRADRFPRGPGKMRLVSTPPWSLKFFTCESELWLIIGKPALRDESEVASPRS